MSAAAERRGAGLELAVADVSVEFGGVRALRGASMTVRQGELVGLIGPNGAGKTTLVNCISGFVRATSGTLNLGDVALSRLGAHERAQRGLVRTFQNIRLFKRFTALQNVEAAALAAGNIARSRARSVAESCLTRVGIEHLAQRYAETLSYGDQRRVEIARALAAGPRFLLLDEPAAGMNEAESDQIGRLIRDISENDACGVVLIEHDLRLIMTVSDHVYVLNEGHMISEGTPDHVRNDPLVIAAYVGG
jgi:ABC-type branched-subunit amino acid transport system ATPase component